MGTVARMVAVRATTQAVSRPVESEIVKSSTWEDGAPPAAGVAEVTRSIVTQPTGRASGLTHVYAVHLVRVLTLACVIAAHTTASVNSLDSASAGGAAMLLHFTPETFFALTAFVLVYPYRDALAASLRADRGALRHLDHDLHRAGTDHGAAATGL